MKQLLYYDLDNKFVSEQVSAGGDGSKVVSVYNGVAWTEDSGVTYYRDNTTQKVTYNITVYYKNADFDTDICEPDIIQVKSYSGCSVTEMLYPKKFDNLIPSITEAYLTVSSDMEYTFFYNVEELAAIPLSFIVRSGGTIYWKRVSDRLSTEFERTIQYSKNGAEWVNITCNKSSTPQIQVNAGDVVRFRGDNSSYGESAGLSTTDYLVSSFSGTTCVFDVCGNIMSLINSTDFKELNTFNWHQDGSEEPGARLAFSLLFSYCTGLTNANNLLLPVKDFMTGISTSTSNRGAILCYARMFKGCTSLVTAPELPATKMSRYCYVGMFEGCTSLITAPELPTRGFDRDADWCYASMFRDCSSLNYVKTMMLYFKKTVGTSTYSFTNNWLEGVSQDGTFVKNSEMTTYDRGSSYIPAGWTVVDA